MTQISFQALLDGMEGIAYVVDGPGRIVACGRRHWSEFANANDGEAIADPEDVIGRLMLDFVTGEEVVAAYCGYMRGLFDRSIPGVTFEYRCDAPDVRRDIWMAIHPIEADGRVVALLFQSIVINELSRPPIGLFDYAGMRRRLARQRPYPIVTMCSYCHDIASDPSDGDGRRWMKAETYYRSGGTGEVQVSHGICPTCHAKHVVPFLGVTAPEPGADA